MPPPSIKPGGYHAQDQLPAHGGKNHAHDPSHIRAGQRRIGNKADQQHQNIRGDRLQPRVGDLKKGGRYAELFEMQSRYYRNRFANPVIEQGERAEMQAGCITGTASRTCSAIGSNAAVGSSRISSGAFL